MLDYYCERTLPGLLNEPLNAVTNAAFFVAAYAIWRLLRRHEIKRPEIYGLWALVIVIGTGSTLFHTLATHWAMLSDAIPILLFQCLYIPVYAHHTARLRPAYSAGLLLGFIMLVAVFGMMPPEWLNGSIGYMPALIYVTGLGLYHAVTCKNARFALIAAAGLFLLSLIFRTLDMALCPLIPFGVHFMWHILNAGVLYLAMRAIILNMKRNQDGTLPL